MKVRVTSISVLVVVLFLPAISLGQEQSVERKSIESFYTDADNHSKTLLLKLLQFTAPYPGYYQETSLETNGTAFSARVVPNWAVQNSVSAKLDDALLAQIRQMVVQVDIPFTPVAVEPRQGQLHSAFVFYDGQDFVRLNYNGRNPAQIDAILAILNKEFEAATRAWLEEFTDRQKSIRETYGEWENRAGITMNTGIQMHNCKGDNALVVLTAGQHKTVPSSSPVPVSVYHALIFYPGAAVTSSGSGGRWSSDPVQSYVLIWTLPSANGSASEDTAQRKFEILHNAFDASVTIAGKTYQLSGGNMFVIRIGADWVPSVTQLSEVFEEKATPESTLNRFKLILKKDAAVQQLELK